MTLEIKVVTNNFFSQKNSRNFRLTPNFLFLPQMFFHVLLKNPPKKIYDCDFNQQLGYGIGGEGTFEGSKSVFDVSSFTELMPEQIRMDNHCFGCTAGMGSS